MQSFRKSDRVEWNFNNGKACGKVVKKLTSDIEIGKHTVRASRDDPQYLVETDNGNQAAHKPDSLNKL